MEIEPELDTYWHESLGPLTYLSIRDRLVEEESSLEFMELMSRAHHTIDTRYHDGLDSEHIDQDFSDIRELVEEGCIIEEELLSLGVCPTPHQTSDTIEDIMNRRGIRESDTPTDTEPMRWFLAIEE
jgi:hypothetical protein